MSPDKIRFFGSQPTKIFLTVGCSSENARTPRKSFHVSDPNNYIRIRNLLPVQVADNSIVFSSNVNGLSDDLEILKTETGTSVTVWPWRVIGMGGGSYLALEILKPW